MLKTWKANELVTLDSFADYRHGAPAMKRVIVRHVAEPSAQRLMVEKGDVDLSRNLTPDQIKGVAGNADLAVDANPEGTLMYLAANAAHPILGDRRVSKALRYLVDYEGMAGSFLAGQQQVHQAVWPSGLWGALDETPYSLDVDAAKALLADAGHSDGFKVRLDTLTNSPFPEVAQSMPRASSATTRSSARSRSTRPMSSCSRRPSRWCGGTTSRDSCPAPTSTWCSTAT